VVARLRYAVFDEDGECVSEAGDATEHIVGYGQLWPALERAVDGRSAGESVTVELRPKDAFGERDPTALAEVDRSEFPPDVAPGDRFEAEDGAGAAVLLTVLDVGEDFVVIDRNHPLAGQKLRVELEVVGARVATEEELGQAEAALAGPPEALISPQRLLRGPGRRYEETPELSAVSPPGEEAADESPGEK
jgi:FKBP-type peptidyl-prolyl cis-trans isomerase SlyD